MDKNSEENQRILARKFEGENHYKKYIKSGPIPQRWIRQIDKF
jgi:hypothetical protein